MSFGLHQSILLFSCAQQGKARHKTLRCPVIANKLAHWIQEELGQEPNIEREEMNVESMTVEVAVEERSDEVVSHERSRTAIVQKVSKALQLHNRTVSDIESVLAQSQITIDEVKAVFGDTHGLLRAMVFQLAESLTLPLMHSEPPRTLEATLFDFGCGLTNAYFSSHLVGLYRIALTEATRHAGFTKDFYENGPGLITNKLAEFLDHAATGTLLPMKNSLLLADHFLAILPHTLDVSEATWTKDQVLSVECQDAVSGAVTLFCNGVMPRRRDAELVN